MSFWVASYLVLKKGNKELSPRMSIFKKSGCERPIFDYEISPMLCIGMHKKTLNFRSTPKNGIRKERVLTLL